MPARSEQQRRYLNMRFGHEWVKKHHYDNKGKLPRRAGSTKRTEQKGTQDEMIRLFQKRRKPGRGRG